MDLRVLPEILALSALFVLLQPMARRVGERTTPWLLGWGFLLAHYLVRAVSPDADELPGMIGLAVTWTLLLSALFLLRAAANQASDVLDWSFFAAVSIPVLAAGGVYRLLPGAIGYQRCSACLFLLPVVLLVLRPSHRRRPLVGIAGICAVVGVSFAILLPLGSSVAAGVLLTVLFCTVAWVYATESRRLTRASVAGTAGLAAWGLSYPAIAVAQYLWPGANLDHHLFRIPQYLAGAALTMALIEQVLFETEYLALHDPLTGLANRRLLEEHVERAIRASKAHGKPLALLVIDVDGFKQINDTLGHAVGDELLRALAVRLSWHIGPADLLARTGGDEFTAILAGTADEHHLRFVARAMMSAASVPFTLESQSIDCRISLGIALAHPNAIDGATLRRLADQAMYQAKGHGGGTLAFADLPAIADLPIQEPVAGQLAMGG